MPRVNRLIYAATIAAAASLSLLPASVSAAATPSPSLDTVLAAPPATDFNEMTTSPLHGRFTAKDFAALSNNSSAAAETEATLNRDGFVDGFGKTWAEASSGHALIEAVLAFSGGRGAQSALTSMEASDKADTSYKKADTISGITPYYGAHFVDSSNQVVEDFFAFVKGNDIFAMAFVSSKDDVLAAAVKQAQAQYASAPSSTIPSSQWPENTGTASSFPVAAVSVGAIVVLLALAAGGFFLLRRRTPQMTPAYAAAGAPAAYAAPVEVQMSPDGNYWWDGQAWRDASQEAPSHAQRSPDGAYWWDGRTWRAVPAAAPAAPATPPQDQPPPSWLS